MLGESKVTEDPLCSPIQLPAQAIECKAIPFPEQPPNLCGFFKGALPRQQLVPDLNLIQDHNLSLRERAPLNLP
jgi:hypothetical protein